MATLCIGDLGAGIWHSNADRSGSRDHTTNEQRQGSYGYVANGLAAVFYVVSADRQWSEHRPVLSLGVFLVCDKHVALPLVDFSARPRYYLRGCHALADQITYRVGISDDRVISLYTTRTCACDSQSLPVAEAASGALVQSPRGENVDIIP